MRRSIAAVWLLIVLLAGGCQAYTRSTPRTFLEGTDAANYERIFDERPSPEIQIVHSVVVDYPWRLGVVTTDDWEFEILAPRAWIESHVQSLRLASAGPAPSDVEGSLHWRVIRDRKLRPIRDWYVPRELDQYEVYYLALTDVPYVHMLVDREPAADGRLRVFVSKH